MLYTATAIDAIPSGTAFYLTEDGIVQIGGEQYPDSIPLGTSQVDIPAGAEFFATLGILDDAIFSVSLEPPPNMVSVKITREDLLNDEFWIPTLGSGKSGDSSINTLPPPMA